jgi:hypothetical protein
MINNGTLLPDSVPLLIKLFCEAEYPPQLAAGKGIFKVLLLYLIILCNQTRITLLCYIYK